MQVEQVGLGVGVGNLIGHAPGKQRGPHGMKTEIARAGFHHHGLRGRVGEGNQARFLGRILDGAHEGETGPILGGALRLGYEVAALGKAGLILGVVDAAEHFRRDFAATERPLQIADIGHAYLPAIQAGECSGRTLRWFASEVLAREKATRKF